jgi:hypothetical protein
MEDSNFKCQTVSNIWSWAPDGARHQDGLIDWPSVVTWLWLRQIGLLVTCLHADFFLRLFFEPEDGGDMFRRRLSLNGLHAWLALWPWTQRQYVPSVGTAMVHGLDGRGIRVLFSEGERYFFIFFTASSPAIGPTQPPKQWVPRTLSLELKRQGRVADRWPPPPATEVKKLYLYSPIRLHGAVLNK